MIVARFQCKSPAIIQDEPAVGNSKGLSAGTPQDSDAFLLPGLLRSGSGSHDSLEFYVLDHLMVTWFLHSHTRSGFPVSETTAARIVFVEEMR